MELDLRHQRSTTQRHSPSLSMSHHFLFIRRILLLHHHSIHFAVCYSLCCASSCIQVTRTHVWISAALFLFLFSIPFANCTSYQPQKRSSEPYAMSRRMRLRQQKGPRRHRRQPLLSPPTQRSSLPSPMEQMLKTLSSSGRAQLDTPQRRCSCIQAATIGTWICTCLGGCYPCS